MCRKRECKSLRNWKLFILTGWMALSPVLLKRAGWAAREQGGPGAGTCLPPTRTAPPPPSLTPFFLQLLFLFLSLVTLLSTELSVVTSANQSTSTPPGT